MGFSEDGWIRMPETERGRSAPMFRHEFQLDRQVQSARLSICGLGYYEAFINGQRVGDHVLDPAQTDYETRCFYVCHDVTAFLRAGANAIGVLLGDGWFHQDLVWGYENKGLGTSYGTPRLWAELAMRFADGTSCTVNADPSWKCARSPITANNIYAGETYDARLEQPGWDMPGFDDRSWQPAELAAAPGGRMEEQKIPPIRKIEEIQPVDIVEPRPSIFVADMGQNFSGWVRIHVCGKPGTEIRLKFAETISPDGMIDTASTGVFATKVEQVDSYACKGAGTEVWEPRFTYHEVRYVEIVGWPGRPRKEDITGVVVHTAMERAGEFSCSDARLNQLHNMVLWTHRSNMHGFPEDCPARERCGWLGDAHVVCEYSLYNFRSMAVWEKYLDDIETTRARFQGLPGYIAPGKRNWGAASPDWMAAMILVPWFLYVYGGNRRVLQKHWDGMSTVIEHFGKQAKDWILSGGLGDWCDPEGDAKPTYTKEAVTTTIWFWLCADVMARTAELLDRREDSSRYAEWSNRVSHAFQEVFFDRSRHTFGSQTADAMALHFGLVPDGEEPAVVTSLVRDIRATHHTHHTVGIMGLRFLFEVLTRKGHGDLALALLHQDTYPSFGDLIRRRATTLWEYWGQSEGADRSLNHPMMGGFDNWFYNTLAGIRPDPRHPGFKRFILEPYPVPGLEWVRAQHESPYGRICSEWRAEQGVFRWNVTVPPGTTADALLPDGGESRALTEGHYNLIQPLQRSA